MNMQIPDHLKQVISSGQAVLFLGAGFSLGARNPNGPVSSTSTLTEDLLTAAGANAHSGLNLMQASQLARKRLGKPWFLSFLERKFRHTQPQSFHSQILSLQWYRIYTTNVDDLVENHYAKTPGRRLFIRNALDRAHELTDEPNEITLVKLHGDATGQSEVVFSKDEYARVTVEPNYWLEQFASDYSRRTFVFIGSSIGDLDFWHYLHLRATQARYSLADFPLSYIVTPDASDDLVDSLSPLNVRGIPWRGDQFATALVNAGLTNTRPAPTATPFSGEFQHLLRYPGEAELLLSRQFINIKAALTKNGGKRRTRSNFFLGEEPQWDDIREKRDAKRTVSSAIIEGAKAGKHQLLEGAAGQGKTTTLMRVAEQLSMEGATCYWFIDSGSPNIDFFTRLLRTLPGGRIYLFIDRFNVYAQEWARLLDGDDMDLNTGAQATILTTDRRPSTFEYSATLQRHNFERRTLGRLDANEIRGVLAALERESMLGQLRGLTPERQFHEFDVRADKQLLVALREATSGKGFDQILRDEFLSLPSETARIAFLTVAVAHMRGRSMPEGIFAAALRRLNRNLDEATRQALEDALVRPRPGFLATRHPVIAEVVIKTFANRNEVAEVLIAVFNSLAPYVRAVRGRPTRSAEQLIFHALIPSEPLYEILKEDTERVYDGMKSEYKDDAHFWLHYGSLALRLNDLDRAENFLNQSGQLRRLEFVDHQRARLYFMRAEKAKTAEEAREYYNTAWERMTAVLQGSFTRPEHPRVTLMGLTASVIRHWGDKADYVVNLERAKRLADDVFNDRVLYSNQRVKASWRSLMEAIARPKSSSRPKGRRTNDDRSRNNRRRS